MERIFLYSTGDDFDGRTIKTLLQNKYGMSAGMIKSLKKENDGITVNGERKFVTHILHKGDELKIIMREQSSAHIIPVRLDIDIIYEDEDIVIVNKPPDMPTHPSPGHYENTLANALMYHFLANGYDCAFHPVNRLDKDTSGLMAVAKNRYCHYRLSDAIIKKTLVRRYRAIVTGETEDSDIINAPIKRSPDSLIKRCVSAEGKRAVTHYRTIRRGKYSLVELELETGRTHQIRVHMAHIGHPLLGDWLYGTEDKALFPRQALHSSYICFTHPVKGIKLEFRNELSPDMADFLIKETLIEL